MRLLRSFLLVIFLLAFASGIALADIDEGLVPASNVQPWSYQLGPIFESASAKYQVPLPLLLTLAKFGSGFENRGDAPTIEGGYGVMALRQNSLGGTSLAEAAALTSVTEEDLKTRADLNIYGAAAVLDSYATMWQVDRNAGLDAWLDVIVKYAALDPESSRMFAMEIYDKLQKGMDQVNSSGERFSFEPRDIGSINLSDLLPHDIVVQSTDYGPAIWSSAASCNYTASYTSKDTVVCHTVEGSAAGAVSWFRNCSAQVSAHYVVSESGTVYQCVREMYKAWHVSCLNSRCIGIEHEGYASDSSHPTALYDASALLTRHLCNAWGIPKAHRTSPPGILGHIDVTHCCCGTHTDPGSGWNWTYYINKVNGTTPPPPPPTWANTYHAQSYPSTMVAGSTATAWAEFTNTGTGHWTHDKTRLGTSSPQDRSSPFYNSGNWVSAKRPSDVDQTDVAQNAVGRFSFTLKAPATAGTYTEHYKVVEEGVAWFGAELTWTITVTPANGNITGTVRNSYNSQPISGATVAISGGPSATTNSSGVYTITGVSPGTKTLNVSAAGFTSTSGTATVTAGATTTKDFSLTSSDHTAPTAPAGLTATAVSPSQINLAWSASTDSGGSGLAGYIVYRGGAEIGRTTVTSYSNNGLAANTAYSYTVKAYDNAGNVSGASNTASATTQIASVPIFQDGFANTNYWEALVQSPMPGPYPPSLVADNHDHSQFTGGNSLKTLTSTDGNQGCLIGHTFDIPFASAKFESYFFDGTGLGYVGDFESSTEGWASYPLAYGTLTTASGGVSGKCLSISDGGWTGGSYKEFTSGFAVGETYWLTISEKIPAAGTWGTAPYVFVRFINSSGATIGTDNTAAITANNAWHTYSLTGTIPAGTAKIWIGQYMYLNDTFTYTYGVDSVSFTTSTAVTANQSRQGLQVRCIDPSNGLHAIYYLGTYSASPGSYAKYSAGYYKVCGTGCTGWYWPGANCADRSPGWHKFTIDFLPYSGATNTDVHFYIDGTQVATAERPLDTQTYGLNMVAYGYHYRVNVSGWFDDCAMYAAPPVTPTMGTPAALSTTSIRWNLTDNSNTEMGFNVIDAAENAVATATVSNGTGSAVHADETGLDPNTPYTRAAKAFNGSLDSSPSSSATRWTLSVAPIASSVTCNQPTGWTSTPTFTFTAVGGFDQGTVDHYLYAWDTSPTHVWTGSEATWDSGELILEAVSEGNYYLHVKGYNGENVPNGALDLGPYRYAGSAPTNPTAAVETHGAQDGIWQSTVGSPSFTWSGATSGAGIAGYLVYFGSDVAGTGTTYVTSSAYSPGAKTAGTYYLRLRSKDSAGNVADDWATLFTFQYDNTAPGAPTVTDDGYYTGSATKLHGAWYGTDSESDVVEYQYAVGTSAGASDAVGWTSAGTDYEEEIVIPAPGLVTGPTYYISAKAKNSVGLWSAAGSSDGIRLAPAAATIAAAKGLANATPVALSNKIVTAGFPNSFYMEEANRTSGILVLSAGPYPGALVTVGGLMGINDVGERAILNPVVTIEASPDETRLPGSLLLRGSALGGSAFNSFTSGAAAGIGLNNVGLLVKVCGVVLAINGSDFTISDGSSTGPIKVLTAGIDLPDFAAGDFISVVGISSLEFDTVLEPVVRLIDGDGIVRLN